MVFSVFLLQGLHLRVHFDNLTACPSNLTTSTIKAEGAGANLCLNISYIEPSIESKFLVSLTHELLANDSL